MIGFPNPQQQAWWDAVQQKNAAYQQQIDQALDLATLHQALSYPRNYGPIGQLANPLLARANNPGTALFGPTNPESGNLLQAYFAANAPGGNTIGLPGGDSIAGNQIGSPDALVQALLSRQGAG